MVTRKQIGIVAVFLAGCVIIAVGLFYGPPIESGTYSASGGFWMRASGAEIILGKGGSHFAKLKNTTRVWPVVDSEDEKCLKYVIRGSNNGEVTLVRKENPPFARKEILFRKDK